MKMKLLDRAAILTFVAIVGSAVALPAHAIPYTVDGLGPVSYPSPLLAPSDAANGPDGYPGDTVELQSYANPSFNLVVGTTIQNVNTLLWTVNYTYGGTSTIDGTDGTWTNWNFPINASRSIIIDGVTGTLSQTGSLSTTFFTDTLSFSDGLTTMLLVDGYNVAITPLALLLGPVGDLGPVSPQFMQARFDVFQTPLPAAFPLFATGLGAMGLLGWRRKRKAATAVAAA
jgi:hypothetical protein